MWKRNGKDVEKRRNVNFKIGFGNGIISLAFVWCYHIGIERAKIKPIKILKHGYKEKSYFMYGLEFLSSLFSNFIYNAKKIKIVFDFFKFILTSNPNKFIKLERIFKK